MGECVSCEDEVDITSVRVGEDQICQECFVVGIVPQFHEALADQTKYPVRYRGASLEPESFKSFFSESFLAKWGAVREEYETKPDDKLICQNQLIVFDDEDDDHTTEYCNAFLGRKSLASLPTVVCRCGGTTCTKCSASLQPKEAHECKFGDSDDSPFHGLAKGVDYQTCPGCKIKVQLRDGCNAIKCSYCKKPMYFICGKVASDYSGHWNAGNPCPRFGRKGDQRALHDDPDAGQQRFGRLEILERPDDAFQLAVDQGSPNSDSLALPEGAERNGDWETVEAAREELWRIHDQIVQMDQSDSDVRNAHALIHLVLEEIREDVEGILSETTDQQRFMPHPRSIARFFQIDSLAEKLEDGGFDLFPELADVYDSYMTAWLLAVASDPR